MELLEEVFNLFRKKDTAETPPDDADDAEASDITERLLQPKPWHPPPVDGEHIRIVVSHDTKTKGKVPLYDDYTIRMEAKMNKPSKGVPTTTTSTTSTATPLRPTATSSSSPSSSSSSSSPRPRTVPKSTDLEILNEMMFGSIPLNYSGVISKIHYLKSPRQIMLTKLFSISPQEFLTPLLPPSPPQSAQPTVTATATAQATNLHSHPHPHPHPATTSTATTTTTPPLSPPSDLPQAGSEVTTPTMAAAAAAESQTSPLAVNVASTGLTAAAIDHLESALNPDEGGGGGGSSGGRPSSAVFSPSSSPPTGRSRLSPSGSVHSFSSLTSSAVRTPTLSAVRNAVSDDKYLEDELASMFMQMKTSRSASAASSEDSDVWEEGTTSPYTSPYGSYNRRRYHRHRSSSIERQPGASATPATHHQQQKRIVFGMAILIKVEKNRILRDFLFSHFSLLEHRIQYLRSELLGILSGIIQQIILPQQHTNEPGTERLDTKQLLGAFALHQNEAVRNAMEQFRHDVCLLYMAPRIQEPLWLNIVTFPQRRSFVSYVFMREFAYLMENYDNRRTNFFLSTLLTTVLTHHLAWVPTVVPPSTTARDLPEVEPVNVLDVQAKIFPYNPIWAQLSDLYGSIGTPSTVTRTIVVGTQTTVVRRLLYILTYFIRCGEILENVEQIHQPGGPTDPSAASKRSRTHGSEESMEHWVAANSAMGHDEAVDDSAASSSYVDIVSLLDTFHSGSPTNESVPLVPRRFNEENISHARHSVDSATSDRQHHRVPGVGQSFGIDFSRDFFPNENEDSPNRVSSATEPDPFSPSPRENEKSLKEIRMPESALSKVFPSAERVVGAGDINYRGEQLFCRSYGRSLFLSLCDEYVPDCVLQGLRKMNFLEELRRDLQLSIKFRILDEHVYRSSCILADTNDMKCEVLTCSTERIFDPQTLSPSSQQQSSTEAAFVQRQPVASEFIQQTLSSLRGMAEMNIPAEACLMHLEDRLQELYYKSILLSEFVNEHAAESLTYKSVAKTLGLNISDIPLLVAVASTHHPNIGMRFNISELFTAMKTSS